MRASMPCLLAALLAGCAQYRPATLPAQAGPEAAINPNFATELAGPATFLPPMPTAVVALKPDDLNRNRAFCSAVMQLPTAQQARAASVLAPNLILTRWLVQLPDIPAERATDCDFLVGAYDYARAARLLASIHPRTGTLQGQGPFLLMIVPDRSGLRVAGLDGSTYAPSAFPTFIASWSDALARTERQVAATPDRPGIVRSLFDLVAAVLRGAGAAAGGLIEGVLSEV